VIAKNGALLLSRNDIFLSASRGISIAAGIRDFFLHIRPLARLGMSLCLSNYAYGAEENKAINFDRLTEQEQSGFLR
tara:strand:+ start:329 stop:559 length:231 start_codon:yes stop_codon:yes gene_type:complete